MDKSEIHYKLGKVDGFAEGFRAGYEEAERFLMRLHDEMERRQVSTEELLVLLGY
jgi:hypothetical protein